MFLKTTLVCLTLFLSSQSFAAPIAKTSLKPDEKIAHLFNRLAYGLRPSDIDGWKNYSQGNIDSKIKQWIEIQLNPDKIREPALDQDLTAFPVLFMTTTEARAHYKTVQELAEQKGISKADIKEDNGAMKELKEKADKELLPDAIVRQMVAQKVMRAVRSKRQLQEVLVDFWYNHFNVDISKGKGRWYVPSYERDVIRKHLFGKFDDFLSSTAHHPAMLFYLDNFSSRGPNGKHENRLNENYAREILELHTLGVDGGYTQKDVTELARILTGWSISDPDTAPAFTFKEKEHDHDAKVFLNEIFPAGQGQEEGERALQMIAHHPSTAHFISTELARFFVSDTPPKSLVDRMTKKFLSSNGDLTAVYRELFYSQEFWARGAYRAKIKKPSQFVFSAIRTLDGDTDEKNNLAKVLAEMGEDLYKCGPPTGFRDIADAWVNPGAMVYRLNFALKVSANRFDGIFVQIPDAQNLTSKQNHQKPQNFIRMIAKKLMFENLSPSTEAVVLKEFDPHHHEMMDGEIRPFSLVKAVGMILGSPDFQRK
jgi:uncharacterized protein (DUF1800 family)